MRRSWKLLTTRPRWRWSRRAASPFPSPTHQPQPRRRIGHGLEEHEVLDHRKPAPMAKPSTAASTRKPIRRRANQRHDERGLQRLLGHRRGVTVERPQARSPPRSAPFVERGSSTPTAAPTPRHRPGRRPQQLEAVHQQQAGQDSRTGRSARQCSACISGTGRRTPFVPSRLFRDWGVAHRRTFNDTMNSCRGLYRPPSGAANDSVRSSAESAEIRTSACAPTLARAGAARRRRGW